MSGVNLIRVPEVANTLLVTGLPAPGIAKVSGAVFAQKLDVQQGSGTAGAKVVYHGRDVKEFTVELHLLTEEQYDDWLDGPVRAILLTPPTGKTATSFDLFHPALDEVGITSALLKDLGAAEPVGDGSYKVKLQFQHQLPPKPSSGTPSGSKTVWQKAPPGDKADQEIDDLIRQAKNV